MKSYNRIMEFFWLFIGITSLCFGVYMSLDLGFSETWFFYLFSVMALVLSLLRRTVRKKTEREESQK